MTITEQTNMSLADNVIKTEKERDGLLLEFDNGCVLSAQKLKHRWSRETGYVDLEEPVVFCRLLSIGYGQQVDHRDPSPIAQEYNALETKAIDLYNSQMCSLGIQKKRINETQEHLKGCLGFLAMPFIATYATIMNTFFEDQPILGGESFAKKSIGQKLYSIAAVPFAALALTFVGCLGSMHSQKETHYFTATNPEKIHEDEPTGDPALLIDCTPKKFYNVAPIIAFPDGVLLDNKGLADNSSKLDGYKERCYDPATYFLSIEPHVKEELYQIVDQRKEIQHQWLTFNDELQCGDYRGLLESYNFVEEGEKIVWSGQNASF